MSDEQRDTPDAVEEHRRMLEHEDEARRREAAERGPEDPDAPDRPAPPGQAEQPRG
jgi:hypothetical protein